MRRSRGEKVPTPAPATPAADLSLPSDSVGCRVSLKLTGEYRHMLDVCRRRLANSYTGHTPTISVVMRTAISALYHSLTGHPPTGELHGQP